ncbi:hypothetical protein QQ045_028432 [Rhodiola kirilowii]
MGIGAVSWIAHLWCSNTFSGNKGKPVKISTGGDQKLFGFQMPLHYPRFKKSDYEKMDEERLKLLLAEYGLGFEGSLDELREYAIGIFLWPHQL